MILFIFGVLISMIFGYVMTVFLMFYENLGFFLGLLLLVGMDVLFFRLLKARTAHGREILDQIEGFKLFLSFAEKDRLNQLYPDGLTPQVFEQYLPYALALGVEQAWAEGFTEIFAQLDQDAFIYQPSWYRGRSLQSFVDDRFNFSMGDELSSAIAASANPPGSTSGLDLGNWGDYDGGGGSSGGGGGGGGGGGW